MTRTIKYRENQRLWFRSNERYHDSQYVIVSKVGRKWARLQQDDDSRYHMPMGRVALDSVVVNDETTGSQKAFLWETKEESERAQARSQAWRALTRTLSNWHTDVPEHVTIEDINQARKLLGMTEEDK